MPFIGVARSSALGSLGFDINFNDLLGLAKLGVSAYQAYSSIDLAQQAQDAREEAADIQQSIALEQLSIMKKREELSALQSGGDLVLTDEGWGLPSWVAPVGIGGAALAVLLLVVLYARR